MTIKTNNTNKIISVGWNFSIIISVSTCIPLMKNNNFECNLNFNHFIELI